MRGRSLLTLVSILLLLAAAGALVLWAVRQPVAFAPEVQGPRVTVEIPRGSSAGEMVQILRRDGVEVSPWLGRFWLMLHAYQLKAGFYDIPRGASLETIVRKLREGEQTLLSLTIPEGWTLRQIRTRVQSKPWLQADTAAMSEAQLAVALGLPPQVPVEGQLAPDTYRYPPGTSDLVFYKQAVREMQKKLQAAWAQRSPNAQVKTPQEALILASIVEKETGSAADRRMIAGVFNNRLALGMPLQTDPSVIYGMGERYAGKIHKADLQADGPYNTYTRTGLPPGPIAMPSFAALMAAVQPAETKALYFVAKGDGSGQSEFSETLAQHNEAVREHILKR